MTTTQQQPSIQIVEIAPLVAQLPTLSAEDREKFCAWCWYERQVPESEQDTTGAVAQTEKLIPYPERWSSSICVRHERQVLDEARRLRAERRARKEAAQ